MASGAKPVADLAALVSARVIAGEGVAVSDVMHDSRAVKPGSMYVALRGREVDGHDFIGSAGANGATAVCVDHAAGSGLAELVVEDTRAAIGPLAAAVHDNPSHSIDVVGVTGTNGKTTVTHYIESIATRCGVEAGLVGTIHARFGGRAGPSALTTPEASDFQRLLADMRDAGVSMVAAEVSSHALELQRVDATRFSVAAFTNLSQDHLDFHGDMGSYRAAKQRLFRDFEIGTAVVNVDDGVGAAIASEYEGELLAVGHGGDVTIDEIALHPRHSEFTIRTPWGDAEVLAPVIGGFNVVNVAMAAVCCVAAGIEFADVVSSMGNVAGVPGRYEVVSGSDPIVVIVDYAHTPEGVATAVATARGLTRGRVIGLIGAGGDRDRAKRPAMGEAISAADVVVVTSDNPRTEDPEEIVAAVLAGVHDRVDVIRQVDRRLAIDAAVDAAADGDVVLILGRGHEPHQQVGKEKVPFDDREVAASSLRRRRMSADSSGESGSMAP